MKAILRLVSYNSYIWLALLVGAALTAALARDGLGPLDLGGLAIYAAATYLGYRWWRTPREKLAQFDSVAAFENTLRENSPTLLEFYSDNCGVCMTMRPVVDRLEKDAGRQLQMLRVNVKDDVGAKLADKYEITFTPTFVLFGSSGVKEDEYTLLLDRARVMYWLNQQTITP